MMSATYSFFFIALYFVCFSQETILVQEFVFNDVPFPSCHASTIVEPQKGYFIAAWFGGPGEGDPHTGIWISIKNGASNWSYPVEVANHFAQNGACYNPVLYHVKSLNQTILFYKVGQNPNSWSGFLKRSFDFGLSWSAWEHLNAGILGPSKNKPILLKDGITLLCGSSIESFYNDVLWMDVTQDWGKTWKKYGPIISYDDTNSIIQPTLFHDRKGNVRLLARTDDGHIFTAISSDGGFTWPIAKPHPQLLNPFSGIDAVELADGKIVLVFNNVTQSRSPLHVGVSEDGGDNWKITDVLENEPGSEFSYPAVIQSQDGLIHITYTWKRSKIKHAVIRL